MIKVSSLWKCAVLPMVSGVLVLSVGGCGKVETPAEAPQAAAAPAPAAPAPKSATPNSFAEVTAQLDPGGDFYMYLSTAQWLSKLSQGLDMLQAMVLSGSGAQGVRNTPDEEKSFALLKEMIQKSGLEEISGVGASTFAVSPGLHRAKLFIHHYPEQGTGVLWSLCGAAPHDLAALNVLPVDTAAASYGDFDLAGLINFIRQEVNQSGPPAAQQALAQWQTQFAGVTGLQMDDVLGSLNGAMGAVLTLDATSTISVPVQGQPQTIPTPRLAILLAVKNDLIFKQVDKMLSSNPGVLKVDEPDLRMRTMPLPFLPALNLRPTVAQWNGYLVLASDDKLIRDMAAVQKGGPGYKSTEAYATLSAGLPQQGNSFGLASRRFGETVRKFQSQITVNQPGANAAQAAMVRQWISSYQKIGDGYGVGVRMPDGWLSVAQNRITGP